MRLGKLTTEELSQNVLNKIKKVNSEVLMGAAIGEDCAVIKTDSEFNYLITADPITGATKDSGMLAVEICCNDIAASAGSPLAIMLTVMVPPETPLKTISDIIEEAQHTAEKYGVEIAGGHTEFTDAVNRPIISAFAIGKVKNKRKTSTSISNGDKILVSKFLGLEGTFIICNENQDIKNQLSNEEVSFLINIKNNLSVLKESKLIGDFASAMHDITEGGLKTALEEILSASNLGAKIYKGNLPILPLTNKICTKLNINPAELISSGSMLIFAPDEKIIQKILINNNINCSLIGEVTEDKTIDFV